MILKVKCVEKIKEIYFRFTVGKIYECIDGDLVSDNGRKAWVIGTDPSKWALGEYYKFEVVQEGGLEAMNRLKVIYNPPATILFVDGKKYVSKVHNEEFDEEKGLLMCLAKANGITHLDLKKIMKKAQRPKEKTGNGDKDN